MNGKIWLMLSLAKVLAAAAPGDSEVLGACRDSLKLCLVKLSLFVLCSVPSQRGLFGRREEQKKDPETS